MTRRPRHVHRTTQSTTALYKDKQQSRAQVAKQGRPKAVDFLSESEGPEPAHSIVARLRGARSNDDDDDTTRGSDTDEEDVDAPRVAQWIDDEELELHEQMNDPSASQDSEEVDDGDHGTSEVGPSRRLRSLEDDLSMLPLGTLRIAQRSLALAQAVNDSESDSEEHSGADFSASEDGDVFPHPAKDKQRGKSDQLSKPNHVPSKRTNKHAPVETTSKRPVSRHRVVVGDKLPKPRDPRFMHAVGRYEPSKFKQQYDFLSNLRDNELSTLREHTKRARKLLASSPSHLKAEREEEAKRLEFAMKRAESAVNLDNRERVELEALQAARQTEKEKRKRGKARWWMKRSEKKEFLEKARLNAIASVGGKQAVKKAMEKKQKKVNQKEKKMCPFSRNESIEWSNSKRRRPVGPVDSGRGVKRRKVE